METDSLRRRVHLGLDLETTPEGGVLVRGAHPGGPGAAAGLRAGDRITRVGVVEVAHPSDVVAVSRELLDGTSVRVALLREEAALEVDVTVRPRPLERIEGGRVVLGQVLASSTRLRTILTLPEGAGPFPCVLCLQGIDVASCEHPLDPAAPLIRLIGDWTRAGFATMRVERSGVGDSDGSPPEETDLEVELAGARAALRSLSQLGEVDRERVFLFGSSVGGMIAPVVANGESVAGVVAFGTSAKRWRTSAVSTTERQLALKGFVGQELLERLSAWAEMHAAVCRDGLTPAEAMARRPHLSVLASRQCGGAALFGHHASFFRELDAMDLRAAWAALTVPVLVLRGEHDWVCDAQDAESVVSSVGSSVQFEELASVGHDMRSHASLEASFQRPREGEWRGDVATAATRWLGLKFGLSSLGT